MSKRAEEAALKRFPEEMTRIPYQDLIEAFGGKEYVDFNSMPRGYFQLGYEQAEKDLGWHSVKESLPEETEYVTDNGCHQKWSKSVFVITTGNSVMLCWTKDGEFFCDKDFHFPVKVKYWMPMPKIPKEDEK